MDKSVESYVFERLGTDDRYKQALSGTHDDSTQSQIEATVHTFVVDMARVFDGMLEQLKDPDTLAKFMMGRKK